MKHYARTDRGMVRETNQDYYYADQENNLYIVADGMGGHNAGDTASRLCVKTIIAHYEPNFSQSSLEAYKLHILDLIRKSNDAVYKASLNNPNFAGMGTTLVMAALHNDLALVFSVGDSRAYHMRDGFIEQLTTDHTLVQALFENGDITREETFTHPQRNVITRAIGTEINTLVDTFIVKLEEADKILLCTDGLTNFVGDDEIAKLGQGDVEQAVEACVNLALKRGGRDNITALFIAFGEEKECHS